MKPETSNDKPDALPASRSSDLLACPFCGSKAQIAVWYDGGTQANCLNAKDCWATIGPIYPNDKTKREAKRLRVKITEQWNRRQANGEISLNR